MRRFNNGLLLAVITSAGESVGEQRGAIFNQLTIPMTDGLPRKP
ncbi:MAG: hypothetical protein QNL93_09405 [Opitutae bacterium]